MTDRSFQQLWLINPRSGNGAGQRLLRELSGCAGVASAPLDFSRLPEQLAQAVGVERLIVAGGDGTAAAVLCSPDLPDVPVVPMPLGTANDLARELGIAALVRGVAAPALPGLFAGLPVRNFATWELLIGGRSVPFCNYASLGYEGRVVSEFSAWRARAKVSGRLVNRVMYAVLGAKNMLSRVTGLSVSCDSGPALACKATTGLVLANVRSHMGLGYSSGSGSPFDDRLECISASTVLSYMAMLGSGFGLLSPPSALATGREIEIRGIPSGTALQADGEAYPPIDGPVAVARLRRFVRVACAESLPATALNG